MSKMQISLLALDLDGTLLDDNKSLSKENNQALEYAMRKGICVVPATGRTKTAIPEVVRSHPKIQYAICSNGAAILNLRTDEVLFRCDLGLSLVLKIIDFLSKFDIILDIFADGKVITEKHNLSRLEEFGLSEEVKELVFCTRNPVENLKHYAIHQAVHIERLNIFYRSQEQKEALCRCLSQIPEIILASSLFQNLEVNRKGADKGTALLWLADYLEISRGEIMAIGDSNNDLTMIRAAALGVAMGNGIAEVLDCADRITKPNYENGVAYAIREYIL